MQKDLVACNGNLGCQLQTNAKWFAVSGKQDLLTAGGVWKGLNEAAVIDAAGLVRFASDPVAGLKGLQALVEDPQVRGARRSDCRFAEDADRQHGQRADGRR
ncbi:hypothetical protein [Burkholderia multivorans]|uniref:hypothetical protein n=1 Tax=Burkholderia multivorans TaxID=87883 RepID=UPI0021BF70BC|nr:hypothetical protein [Burkholderia multivorans]